jgi:glyoxylase-like metal-dependent hydrolase (beta-lactamase superfamily II)
MNLEKINRNTHYIQAPTNIGIYAFKNKNVLIIDSAINRYEAKKIERELKEKGLKPKYIINTHAHTDHSGGNNYFKEEYPGVEVFASEKEKVFMEHPEIHYLISSSAYPSKKLKLRKESKIDHVVEEGTNKINDEKFEIIDLPGHALGDIGIITPDRVAFLGDAIFSKYTLEKYPLTYNLHLQERLESLNKIKEMDADYFVISHGKKILNKEEICELVEENIKSTNKTISEIVQICEQPLSREEILQEFSILHDIKTNYKGYLVNLCSLTSFLNYMIDNDKIDASVQDGKLVYFAI